MRNAAKKIIGGNCRSVEAKLKEQEAVVRSIIYDCDCENREFPGPSSRQHQEVREQAVLALRAIEDAQMRCDKALEHMKDGASINARPDYV